MTSNSAQMTIEDLLVQRLKEDTLYSLVKDEDALRKLVEKALHSALFSTTKRSTSSYGGYEEVPSKVTAAAQEYVVPWVKQIFDELAADQQLIDLVRDAAIAAIPGAIRTYAGKAVTDMMSMADQQAMMRILEYDRSKKI